MRHALAAAVAALALAAPAHAADTPHYKVGIIGAGNVGGTLGTVWAKAGDDVLFASRHPDQLKDLVAKAGPNAKAGTPAEAAAFADVVLIAVPYTAFETVAKADGPALAGKVVFDASNAIDKRDGAELGEKVRAKGIGAYSAALLPGVHLARGFNAIHFTDMVDAANKGDAIPIASDDPKAIAVASDLVRQAGFEPLVVPLARAGEFGPGLPLGTGAFTTAQWKQKLGLAK